MDSLRAQVRCASVDLGDNQARNPGLLFLLGMQPWGIVEQGSTEHDLRRESNAPVSHLPENLKRKQDR